MMKIKFFTQSYWYLVAILIVCGILFVIARIANQPKAGKPLADTPIIEPFQHVALPAPLSTSVVIKTQEQLNARDRLMKLLKEIDPLQTQGDYISEQLKVLSAKVKACNGSTDSGEKCQSARADLLQAQSDGIRLGQKLDQLVKEIGANLCIIDPSRSGC